MSGTIQAPTGNTGTPPTASRTSVVFLDDGTNSGFSSVTSILGLIQSGDAPAYLTTATASSTYATLASPALTGSPTVPTQTLTDSSTKAASTAFVKGQSYLTANQSITLSGDLTGSGTTAIAGTLATVNTNVGTFQGLTINAKGLVTAASAMGYATLASPTFTGTVTIPSGASISGYVSTTALATALPSASTSQLYGGTGAASALAAITLGTGLSMTGTTLNASGAIASVAGQTGTSGVISLANLVTGGVAPLASPALTGTPTAPTATAGNSTTQVATTSFVATSFLTTASATSTYAPIASPTLTGVPLAPTAANATNTTQVATCAFVQSAITSSGSFNAAAVAITGGTIDGTVIGGTTPAAATHTTLTTSSTVTINGATASTFAYFNGSKVLSSGTIGTGLNLSSGTLSAVNLGTVTNVTSATGAIVVATGTSTPALTFTPSAVVITPVSHTGTYTFVQGDNNATYVTADTSTVVYTIPTLNAGSTIEVIQGGVGKPTWTASGVTIQCAVVGATGTRAEYSAMRFKWVSSTVVVVSGDVS